MPKVRFIDAHDVTYEYEVPAGTTVMQAATGNNVPGVDGDCGGICACATCHVYVDPEWMERVGGRTEQEEAMLSFSPILAPNSRLSCRITLEQELDGIVIRLPEGQH